MKTVKRSELTNLRMVAGNERKYPIVVIDGYLKRWVGIGWITERDATEADRETYPVVQD